MTKSVLTAIREFARGAIDLVTGERTTRRHLQFLSEVEQRVAATGKPVPGPEISPAVLREFGSLPARPMPPPMPLDDLSAPARPQRVSMFDRLKGDSPARNSDEARASSKTQAEGDRLDLPILAPVLLAMQQGSVKSPSGDVGGPTSASPRVAGPASQRDEASAPGDGGGSSPVGNAASSSGSGIFGFLTSGRRSDSGRASADSAASGTSGASAPPANHELTAAVRKVDKTHRELKNVLTRLKAQQALATAPVVGGIAGAAGASLMSVAPGSALLGGGEAALVGDVLGRGVNFAAAASPLGAPIVYVTPTELHPTAILDGGIPMADHGSHHGAVGVFGSGVGLGSGSDILGGAPGAGSGSILGSSGGSFDGVGGVDRGIL